MFSIKGRPIDHKEAYREALSYLLKKKGRGSQTTVAIEVGISQPQLNRIKTGKRTGDIDTLHAIAAALGTTYEAMLDLGRKLMDGEEPESAKVEKGPFPNYDKIMRLPIVERAWTILHQAAEVHDLKGYLSTFGDERSGKKPIFMRKYLDGEQTEVELYEESLKTFEGVAQRIIDAMKEQGFD